MYVLKTQDNTFYVIKCDSHGYTVDWVTQDEAAATKFDFRSEAKDVRNELDSYWAEQCYITTTSDAPF